MKSSNQNISLRVALFESIRDIPYRIDVQGKDATCLAKNKLLGELLLRMGLKCRVIKAESYWKNTPNIPQQLLTLAPFSKFSHMFLEVFVPETKKWVQVDATWDSALAPILPIARWNGVDGTILACKIINPKKMGSPLDYPYRDFDPKDSFTKGLNDWYTSIRKKNQPWEKKI